MAQIQLEIMMEWKVFSRPESYRGGCRGKPSCCRSHMGLDESFAFSRAFGCAPEESVSARSASMDFLSRTNGGGGPRAAMLVCTHKNTFMLVEEKKKRGEA